MARAVDGSTRVVEQSISQGGEHDMGYEQETVSGQDTTGLRFFNSCRPNLDRCIMQASVRDLGRVERGTANNLTYKFFI